jgi:hypothetical protein
MYFRKGRKSVEFEFENSATVQCGTIRSVQIGNGAAVDTGPVPDVVQSSVSGHGGLANTVHIGNFKSVFF